jgi:flagellar hook-basal body complex protein FliE
MSNNYYGDFLLEEESGQGTAITEVDKELEWIKLHPTAEEAYEAINNLKEEKLRYIRGHPNKSSYKVQKYWTISKAEVGRRIGKESQPLFNSNTFSEKLTKYFDKVNDDLHKSKESRLNKPKKGYQHKTKEELKNSTIELTNENKKLLQNTCEELYGRLLNDIPLDVKRKLGLN